MDHYDFWKVAYGTLPLERLACLQPTVPVFGELLYVA